MHVVMENLIMIFMHGRIKLKQMLNALGKIILLLFFSFLICAVYLQNFFGELDAENACKYSGICWHDSNI